MFVEALVSSINTRRFGSSLVCNLIQALRAAATSGRSCSAACRLFFKCEFEMTKEAEDRGLADHHFFLSQASLKLGQRDVRLRIHPSLDLTPVRFQGISLVAAKLFRTDASSASPTC